MSEKAVIAFGIAMAAAVTLVGDILGFFLAKAIDLIGQLAGWWV